MIFFRHARLVVAGALAMAAVIGGSPALAGAPPSGERILGQSAIEPAYNDVTGNLVYLLTPVKSPFPTHTSSHAVAPLWLVEYPPGYGDWTLNCMRVPGNCPDHDGTVAAVATGQTPLDPGEPSVYGTDFNQVPGHDHLVAPPGRQGDFNIAWEVIEVLFTNKEAATHHLTTLAEVNAAINSHNARPIDLGFAFHCSEVSATAYYAGTPVPG